MYKFNSGWYLLITVKGKELILRMVPWTIFPACLEAYTHTTKFTLLSAWSSYRKSLFTNKLPSDLPYWSEYKPHFLFKFQTRKVGVRLICAADKFKLEMWRMLLPVILSFWNGATMPRARVWNCQQSYGIWRNNVPVFILQWSYSFVW